jgi:hypothetical protein
MTELSIVPECYIDTRVAEIAGQAKRGYNHQHGCGDVAKTLSINLKNMIALGIIDEDKNKGPQAKYFSNFHIIAEKHNLILKKHSDKDQYIIVVCPEIERWLLTDATQIGLAIEDFGLPADLNGLKEISKTQDINKNQGFYRFIKTLLKNEAPSITTLKHWLALFKVNQLSSAT